MKSRHLCRLTLSSVYAADHARTAASVSSALTSEDAETSIGADLGRIRLIHGPAERVRLIFPRLLLRPHPHLLILRILRIRMCGEDGKSFRYALIPSPEAIKPDT